MIKLLDKWLKFKGTLRQFSISLDKSYSTTSTQLNSELQKLRMYGYVTLSDYVPDHFGKTVKWIKEDADIEAWTTAIKWHNRRCRDQEILKIEKKYSRVAI